MKPLAGLLGLLFLVGMPGGLPAQGSPCEPQIQLVSATADRQAGFVALQVLARGLDCDVIEQLEAGDLHISERIGNQAPQTISIVRVTDSLVYDTLNMNRDSVDVLFLVDASRDAQLSASLDMIQTFLERHNNARGNYQVQVFSDKIEPPIPIDPARPMDALRSVKTRSGQPHLYAALLSVLQGREKASNKQLIFLFSGGANVAPDYTDRPRLPPQAEHVYRAVEALGNKLYLFTITNTGAISSGPEAEGAPGDFLRQLPLKTPVGDDGHARGSLPDGVEQVFGGGRRVATSHLVMVKPQDLVFTGRLRQYGLVDAHRADADTSYATFSMGSFNDPVRIGELRQAVSWFGPTLFGLLGVGGLLAVFYFVVPQIRRRQFRHDHVVPYASQPGRQVLDPMTREPIRDGDPVVNICSMVVPLQTWKDCGDQCPHYPGCTNNNLQCSGAGRGQSLNFFALHGVNRRLNWIWFGALGGFSGWVLYALIAGAGRNWLATAAGNLSAYQNAESLLREAVIGACFGLGMTLMLAIMEERSQSRRISVRRILLRTLLGGLAATIAFGGGFLLLEWELVASPIVSAAISWTVFGVALGFVLTLRSTIERKRGLLGGLISGAIGFVVYWLSQKFLGTDLIPKVISLLISGALLGLVLDTVVKLAENYEIEYISPANYYRKVPLSKWLKSSWDILIGTQPGCQVYIKWPDENVLPEHARIKLEGGRVYLYPQGETLVNGEIIHGQKRVQLQSGDTLQLGRRSTTQMRFWER
ncbi:FHA domain-containing protein [Neolewinella xylanilytica]|uniref:FHA domain-containing protein n=1 Tax=Neolewinella xylanilytica TaxID=1514080 RepID=A0A2S6IBB8_9BACT|nr:FHA domain-containing protein [Neolewinella xylanilytica]PPK88788.1 FHA domain-containing protein [Neolewinella xylanilytica]